jgi:serine/threonine protein kinase
VQTASAEDSLIGFALADKYRVLRQIGRGGMGIVYEAEHVVLGKRVAIKLMLEKYANDTEAVARFQREALAASRIGNPHIIDVSDIGTGPDGRSFVVMELLSGAPLSHIIAASGPMPTWRAIHIMRQVLRAVGAAHAKGIVHRDLKPDNIFLVNQDDHHDFVKLLDFGISKLIDPDMQVAATRLTTTGVVMGTPLYMAPEQAMGNDIDHRADIYACGVIMYEMLAGRPPFDGATYAVLVSKLLTQEPPPLASVRAGLPGKLCDAVHRALQKEPQARFAAADQFAAALPAERTPSMIELAGTLDSGPRIATELPTIEGHRGHRRWPWLAVAAAGIVGVATAGVIVMLQQDAPAAAGTTNPPPKIEPSVKPLEAARPPPQVTTGTLEIKSNPVGASVLIDNTPMGKTPIIVTLPKGPHHLHVELAGHTTIDADEEVRAGERSSVVVALPVQASGPRTTRPPVTKPPHPPVTPGPGSGSAATVVRPPIPDPPQPPVIKRDDPPVVKPPGGGGGGTKPNPY